MRTDRLHLFGVIVLVGMALTLVPSCAKPPQWRTDLESVGIRFISAKELKAMMDGSEPFVLVDPRDEIHYTRGRLPEAISIPAENKPLRDVDVRWPKRLLYTDWLPASRSRPLVFYCGGPT